MKLILVFICGLGILSGIAGNSYAQSTKLTFALKDASVKDVLYYIEEHSEFTFMYDNNEVDVNRKVNIRVKDKTIGSILAQLFGKDEIKYQTVGRHIIIFPEGSSAEKTNVSQQNAVSGKVIDESGQSLPGVTVVIKGTTRGTVTNADGTYSFSSVPEDATLIFSFVGMKKQEVVVGNRSTINVTLTVDAIGINEVVAIGYGTQKREDLTGSIVTGNIETLTEQPNVSLIEGLQGSVPGLNISQVNEAGQNPTISIRGQSTLSGEQAPLIVLDNVIFRGELVDINPSDIKSVVVLKDASATAIYGSQASNGVILLTTTTGRGAGEPSIRYSGRFSLQYPQHELRAETNGEKFMQKIEHSDIEQSRTVESGYLERNPNWSETTNFKTSAEVNNYLAGHEFDWYDQVTTDNPYTVSHNISVSNSTEKNSYFTSIGYTSQDGYMLDESYERINGRINFSTSVTNWLDLDIASFLTLSKYGPETYNLNNRYFEPYAHPYNEDGALAQYVYTGINPIIIANSDVEDKRLNLGANITGTVKLPVNGLKYMMRMGNNYMTTRNNYFGAHEVSFQGMGYKRYEIEYDLSLDNILSYNRVFNDAHEVSVTLLYGIEKRDNEFTRAEGSIFANPVLGFNRLQAADAAQQKVSSGGWIESSLYNMGRISYKLLNKYLVNATIRRDGFSGFSKKNKFGYFPSLALGWIISEESFMKSSDEWLNWLKLRLSYGSTGNRTIGRYTTLAKVTGAPGYVTADGSSIYTQWISALQSSELKWETTTGVNFGIDFRLFNSRLNGSIDYYNNNTTDLLYDVDIPAISRYTVFPDNLGKIHNSGLEIQLTTVNIRKRDFSWTTDFTFSRNRDEIVTLLGFDLNGDGKEDDLISEGLFIGKSLGSIYDYKVDGIWQLDDEIPPGYDFGSFRVLDLNEDGTYDPDDKIILGNERPSYRFSINSVLNYKNWSLKLFVNSVQGGKNWYLGADNMYGFQILNQENHFNDTFPRGIDYWTPENPDAKYQRPGIKVSSGLSGTRYTSRSFVRLRDVSLSYNFNTSHINFINDMRIILSGRNLLTLTKWPGWDPETGEGITRDGRPVLASYSLGIDVTF